MGNLKIEYNEKILSKLKEHDFLAETIGSVLFVLFALDEKRFDLLDEYDDRNKQRRVLILYRQMERRSLLKQSEDEHFYELTPKAVELIAFVRSEFEHQHKEVHANDFAKLVANIKGKTKETKNENRQLIKSWVKEYISHFPKDRQDNPAVVIDRIEEFMERFTEYADKDIIIGAAKLYNDFHKKKGTDSQYIKRSQYFIYFGAGRGRTWDLATWCEKYKEKPAEPEIDASIFDIV